MREDNEPQEPTFFERVRKRAKTLAEGAKLLGRKGLTSARDAADQASSATVDLTNKLLDQASALSEKAKEGAACISAAAWEQASGIGKLAWDNLLAAPEKFASLFVRECTLPAILLPTGSGVRDFQCVFRFDETVEQLNSGLLVRPLIQVWAGREDIDRSYLAATLKNDFTRQLSQERERRRRQNESQYSSYVTRIARLKTDREEAGKGVEAAATGLIAALLLMFCVANPIFDLLFLLLAVYAGKDGIIKAFSYLKAATQIKGNERAAEQKSRELENEFDTKNETFQQAIKNIHINVHPFLNSLVANFCELDDKAFIPSDSIPGVDTPPVEEYLRQPSYRAALPSWFHPLLDERLG